MREDNFILTTGKVIGYLQSDFKQLLQIYEDGFPLDEKDLIEKIHEWKKLLAEIHFGPVPENENW